MAAILDASFLFALANQSDRNHDRVLAVAQTIRSKAIQPFKLPIATPFLAVQVGQSRHILSTQSCIESIATVPNSVSSAVVMTNCSYNMVIVAIASMMEFEWDEAKRLANLDKHGVDFIDVPAVFDGDTVTVEDDRYSYGERRFVTFSLLQGRVIAVVHTDRGESIRIISARKATKNERRIYFQQISD